MIVYYDELEYNKQSSGTFSGKSKCRAPIENFRGGAESTMKIETFGGG